jgi:transglutaminase-like putative cysteine protease
MMKQGKYLLVAAVLPVLLILLPARVSSSTTEFPLAVTHTLSYTVTVHWWGNFYPDMTTIRVEVYDIPIPTDYQKVSYSLQDGRIENINGRPVWVIQKYMREVPYTTITFSANFTVTVDIRDIPPIPHVPVEPPAGMADYLSPDEYVTLSPSVRELAAYLASQTENDLPAVISKFVEWIQKNIAYRVEIGEGVRLKDYEVLQARAGVCDEFSVLFIGLCRSVGIPARYVQGYSVENENLYRNLETGHAWAEIWADKWIPVDPTWVDLGSPKKFTTGGSGIQWRYSGAPPGSKITKVEYSVTPIDWQTRASLERPVILAREKTDNGWRFTVSDIAPIPIMDNLTVKRYVENIFETLPGWPRLVILNPGENVTYDLPGLDQGWVFSRLGGSLDLWEPWVPSVPLPSWEQMIWISVATAVIIAIAVVFSAIRKR